MSSIVNILKSYIFGSSATETTIGSQPAVAKLTKPAVLEKCPEVKYFSQIEHNLYFIWLTPEVAPREPINDARLNNLKHTKQVLGPEWKITLISNNKALIPESAAKLSEIGIDVKNFDEVIEKPTTCIPNYSQQDLSRRLDILRSSTLEEMYDKMTGGHGIYSILVTKRGDYANRYGQYEFHKEEWEKAAKGDLFGSLVDEVKREVAVELPGLVADINTVFCRPLSDTEIIRGCDTWWNRGLANHYKWQSMHCRDYEFPSDKKGCPNDYRDPGKCPIPRTDSFEYLNPKTYEDAAWPFGVSAHALIDPVGCCETYPNAAAINVEEKTWVKN